ncbi:MULTISPECIES: pyridoxal phosphate-dependent aminotransferase [unclassified Leptospira]|uniref:pyridoxal phosphate-dependent aminotransferase n=1 Tax=unclassified Leptospira TaxID=2633828 RepID=UPI0002BF01BD|nr:MULTISPECIES: pyridoxal phosphate-dependent aminotransferase [unclassified Leptospira]EMJ99954.1 aminotransferase, class I/II domain protein [Leptospira sp. B5-022]MCR1791977.1 pyridoxal phosphate-dependent aminotransferase [Leptospira sp. id769339]
MDQDFLFSKFGAKFRNQTGIGQLMEDLGNLSPGVSMLGGGSPSLIPEVEEVWKKILNKFTATGAWDSILGKYETPTGKEETLEILASLLSSETGTSISKEQIAITNGSQNAFYLLLNFYSGKFEDGSFKKIFLPVLPEYIGYLDQPLNPDSFTYSFAKEIVTGEDGFRYELDSSSFDTITDDLGCAVLSRPTNPTGRVAKKEELELILKFARSRKIPFLLDNAYGFPFPGIVYSDERLFHSEGMIQSFSFSKIGLPGVRTGFVLGDPEVVKTLNKANAVLNLAGGNLGQYIALEFVRSGEWFRLSRDIVKPYYLKKREVAISSIRREWKGKLKYRIHDSEGAFFLWVQFIGLRKNISELYPILKEKGVIIVPGKYFYPVTNSGVSYGEDSIRISFAREDSEIQEGIRKIGEILSTYCPY